MPDFSFVQIPQLRAIIEREYVELQHLDPSATPKAVLVLSGAVLEGVLLDALVVSGKFTFEAGCQRHLNEMIGPAKQRGIISEDRLSDSVRKYRALVHLGREARDRIVFGTPDAN